MSEFEKCKDKIQNIVNEKEEYSKKYSEEKRKLANIFQSEIVAGGFIASAIFLITSYLMTYLKIVFPYNLIIIIVITFIGLFLLTIPITRLKLKFLDFKKRINIVILQYTFEQLDKIAIKEEIDYNALMTLLDEVLKISKEHPEFTPRKVMKMIKLIMDAYRTLKSSNNNKEER